MLQSQGSLAKQHCPFELVSNLVSLPSVSVVAEFAITKSRTLGTPENQPGRLWLSTLLRLLTTASGQVMFRGKYLLDRLPFSSCLMPCWNKTRNSEPSVLREPISVLPDVPKSRRSSNPLSRTGQPSSSRWHPGSRVSGL